MDEINDTEAFTFCMNHLNKMSHNYACLDLKKELAKSNGVTREKVGDLLVGGLFQEAIMCLTSKNAFVPPVTDYVQFLMLFHLLERYWNEESVDAKNDLFKSVCDGLSTLRATCRNSQLFETAMSLIACNSVDAGRSLLETRFQSVDNIRELVLAGVVSTEPSELSFDYYAIPMFRSNIGRMSDSEGLTFCMNHLKKMNLGLICHSVREEIGGGVTSRRVKRLLLGGVFDQAIMCLTAAEVFAPPVSDHVSFLRWFNLLERYWNEPLNSVKEELFKSICDGLSDLIRTCDQPVYREIAPRLIACTSVEEGRLLVEESYRSLEDIINDILVFVDHYTNVGLSSGGSN